MIRNESKIINPEPVPIDTVDLPELAQRRIGLDILRLDKIDPVISGNKWFKLKGHLHLAGRMAADHLVTFGGAWSNHIIATAYAAKLAGIPVTGIIRGEKPRILSDTLLAASGYGMHLEFISRESYAAKLKPAFLQDLGIRYPGAYIIPEGGAGTAGITGCEDILNGVDQARYSHILCAIGTGTMYLGLVNAAACGQEIIGIPVLKGLDNLSAIGQEGLPGPEKLNYCKINTHYHFGGYARKSDELLDFMNRFFQRTRIPSDFVYTGKLFFAALDMINKDLFPPGSSLLLIHSGGLQGNRSLPPGVLDF
jgi:1-aminocyclopropane-1-carboxylate deaminase/D-cysteine desulfhydrase-like pyridoxal-dependent ACC family enzyme